MIRLIKKHAEPVPVILVNQGITETETLCRAFEEGELEFKFRKEIYGHAEVKGLLKTVQNGKCCFCEAKIEHISYGDVEHYRPKAAWIQGEENLNRPGYYWLAYDWDNLFLSCEICNRRHKKNYFPLLDNGKRALSHKYNAEEEAPFFIKPDKEDPEQFIEFREEIPFPVNDSVRGEFTIEKLGLDREALNENRRVKLAPIRLLYNLAKDIPITTPDLKKRAVKEIKKIAMESLADDAEYAAMFRSFFKNNPIDF